MNSITPIIEIKENIEEINPCSVTSEIIKLHDGIVAAFHRTLESAWRIGELLTHVKSNVGHGKFLSWIKANLPFEQRTARNYMRLFRARDMLKSAKVSDLAGAYRLLNVTEERIEDIPTPASRTIMIAHPVGDRYLKIDPDLEDPELSRVLVPPHGKSLVGLAGNEMYLIEPSNHYGYFFTTHIHNPEGPDASALGTNRPIIASMLGVGLRGVFGADMAAVTWMTQDCEPRATNKWLVGDGE